MQEICINYTIIEDDVNWSPVLVSIDVFINSVTQNSHCQEFLTCFVTQKVERERERERERELKYYHTQYHCCFFGHADIKNENMLKNW